MRFRALAAAVVTVVTLSGLAACGHHAPGPGPTATQTGPTHTPTSQPPTTHPTPPVTTPPITPTCFPWDAGCGTPPVTPTETATAST